MTTVIPHSSTVSKRQELLPLSPTISCSFVPPSISTYSIVETQISEHAKVLFTQEAYTSKCYVMKLLCSYKDTRYDLDTFEKRQQCQLQALLRNKAFSPEIYIGLAKVEQYNLLQHSISISEILASPTHDQLEPEAEYALIMHQLPEERSLVTLLKKQDPAQLQKHIHLLAEQVANMHRQLLASPPHEGSARWGHYTQLEEKLEHNLELLNLVLITCKDGTNYQYLQEIITWLKVALLALFKQRNYREAFEQRVQAQRIRLCHGDLKVPHIWILEEGPDTIPSESVKILDAIDFNPLYCNVDILSDFAMLVTDIQTRTGSVSLANEMVEDYLRRTDQDNEGAKLVLGYYLVEKALVGAAISIIYDNLPTLGLKHLQVAVKRLHALIKMQEDYLSSIFQTV